MAKAKDRPPIPGGYPDTDLPKGTQRTGVLAAPEPETEPDETPAEDADEPKEA